MNELLLPLESFRFYSPWLLCALVIIPIWAWLRGRYAPVAAVQFSSKKLLEVASRHSRFWPGRLFLTGRYLALALIVVALARPQVERGLTEREATGINIVLVLDFSSTMKTKDFMLETRRVSRIDAMKKVVAEFIQARENDRIGIVRFDRGANLVSPLTLDHQWLLTQLAAEEAGEGTAPGSGMLIAGEALLPAKDQSKVIVTVTDADQVNQGPPPDEVAKVLAPLGIKNHIIQIVDFAAIQQVTASGKLFSDVARTTGGQYFKVSDAAGLRAVYRQIDQLEKAAFKETKQKTWRELMIWPATGAFALLLLELVLTQTVWRRLP
jgi:Ca-activated chloride channel family protein